MTKQVIIDPTARASLELVQNLSLAGPVEHLGDNVYLVKELYDGAVQDIAEDYPDAILKLETL